MHKKIAAALVIIGMLGILAYKFLLPLFEESRQRATSDAKDIIGKITIGVDNWIGYFPLCSPEMRKRMHRSGYNLQCEDDNADYQTRMQRLAKGELTFAVATVDSYLLNAAPLDFPGTIVAVIDESKGGDAIVAWQNDIKNIDDLKSDKAYRIAYTPNSPSEHLIKSMAVHFDVPKLLNKDKQWQVHADGSKDALQKLLKKETQVAVLWEPDVSRALNNKGLTKLLGTEDTDKLIVDILLVNRKYLQRESQAVANLLNQYFHTLKFYRDNRDKLISDAAEKTELDKDTVQTMLNGVDWLTLSQNSLQWFGTVNVGGAARDALVDTIESTMNVLLDIGDFKSNPIPERDPFRLINSQFIRELFNNTSNTGQFGQTSADNEKLTAEDLLARNFEKLTDDQWQKLREIGTLKIHPVVFQSGVDDISDDGKQELEKAVQKLKHYPNFRVVIKGHTGLRGDAQANRVLSQERAESVARFLNSQYGIDLDRLRPLGMGSSQPLAQLPGESSRAYNYRLPRVELFLVTEDI